MATKVSKCALKSDRNWARFFSQRGHDKKDLYNLNEDEELTHYGQSLAEMEKFDIANSDDESEEKGLLSGKINWPFIQVAAVFGKVVVKSGR